MNYERVKKMIVSLALMCVFAFTTLVANVVPANAQGYQPQYVYSYPYGYYPYGYYPYGYYPYRYSPRVHYRYGYYPYRYYTYGNYPYDYHWHDHDYDHDWHPGHYLRRAFHWLF